MTKLLSANFSRMMKKKIFWLCNIFMALMCVLYIISFYTMKQEGFEIHIDDMAFYFTIFIGTLEAVFIGVFLGDEYSNGTIRNKIIGGQKRSTIYMANLITAVAASLIMILFYCIVLFAAGIPVLGGFVTDVEHLVILAAVSLLSTVATAAIFTAVAMLVHSKTISSIACIITVFTLLIAAISIQMKLDEPKVYEAYSYLDESTAQVVEVPATPNPGYVDGTKRKVYEFLMDFSPQGQVYLITRDQPGEDYDIKMLYSCIIIVCVTAGGLVAFRRKDLN